MLNPIAKVLRRPESFAAHITAVLALCVTTFFWSSCLAADDSQNAATHWAFRSLAHPRPPEVRDTSKALNQIDNFILHRLDKMGLSLARPATRQRVVRRVILDLHGLPPSASQISDFLHDDDPGAYERMVSRLLNSPRYGERWARHWLDVARYADNKGYVFFEEKTYPWAWTYRDYVIRAFNEDKPFDRFVLEQLAADKLSDARPADHAAMGFLTVGARFMGNPHDIIDDRIDVVTRGLLGLTVSCSRCHDHKFDPISQEDYYSLYGVFRSSVEPLVPPEMPTANNGKEYKEFKNGLDDRVHKLNEFVTKQRELIATGARSRASEYLDAVYKKRHHPDTDNFMLLTEKGDLVPAIIHRWEVYLRHQVESDSPIWMLWHALSLIPEKEFEDRAAAIIAQHSKSTKTNARLIETFRDQTPASMHAVSNLYQKLLDSICVEWDTHSASFPAARELKDFDSEQIRQTMFGPSSPATIPRELSWGFLDLLPDRPTQGEFQKLLKDLEKWTMTQPGAPARAMALRDTEQPYGSRIFIRGNPNNEGREVTRKFLTALDPEGTAFVHGSGRLELAQRIASRNNPLTARIIVNRVWQHHFGTGLVQTSSDFGLRSSPPSHPELLDWLANYLMDHDWSLKELHRLILTSATYRQSCDSLAPIAATRVDPNNRMLSHFNRQRLDFESVRDSLLEVTGDLVTAIGGPPFQLNSFTPRRTLYGFTDRMNPPGLSRTFDFPEPASSSPGREQTTVASQALFFLNDGFISECARRVAQRIDKESRTNEQKIANLYKILFARSPTSVEQAIGLEFLQSESHSSASADWSYGFQAWDRKEKKVSGFIPLPHWTGTRWQASKKLPDPKLGWVFLDRRGGHPAATSDRCSVRRWTARYTGAVSVRGTLIHQPKEGNGVIATAFSSRHGELGRWTAHHSKMKTDASVMVHKGDTIDFVVDFNGQITHDEHEWTVVIEQAVSASATPLTWDSISDFSGPRSPWIDYVHALLMTNEFVYAD